MEKKKQIQRLIIVKVWGESSSEEKNLFLGHLSKAVWMGMQIRKSAKPQSYIDTATSQSEMAR